MAISHRGNIGRVTPMTPLLPTFIYQNLSIQEMKTMTEQDEEKELVKRIRNLEKKIGKLEKESRIGLEDQLFFSLVFSLALLAIALPSLDVATLFESFGVTLELPTQILSTKVVVIALLIISSALRYRVSILKESSKKRNILRAWSVELLILSFCFLLLDLLIRGLGTFLEKIHFLLLLVPPLLLMISSHFIGILERKWVLLYGYKEQLVSLITFGTGLFVLTTYGLTVIVAIFIPYSPLAMGFLFIISFVLTVIIAKYMRKSYSRTKRTNEKEKRHG